MKVLLMVFLLNSSWAGLPFYQQAIEDKNIKSLIQKKKYKEAFALIKDNNPVEQNINIQLRYDILNKLNNSPNKVVYCDKMLKKYSKSYSVLVEACRYIQTKKLKYGTLDQLIERTEEEQNHMLYLIKALKDL